MNKHLKITFITSLFILTSTALNAAYVLTEIQLVNMHRASLGTQFPGIGGITTDKSTVSGFYQAYDYVDTFQGDVGYFGLQQYLGSEYIYSADEAVFAEVLSGGGISFNLTNDDDDHWQAWAMVVFDDPASLDFIYQTNTGGGGISTQMLDLSVNGSGVASLLTDGESFEGITVDDIVSVGFVLQNIKDDGGSDMYHVSASVSANVPEPMSMVMLLAGSVGLLRRRTFSLLRK